jgi:cytochrome b561
VDQFLHWLMAVVVAVALIVSVIDAESRVYSTAKDSTATCTNCSALDVLVLTLVRLVWRVVDPPPVLKDIPQWMESASNLVQWTLYGLLLLVPLTAMSGAWLEGHLISLLEIGVFPQRTAIAAFGNRNHEAPAPSRKKRHRPRSGATVHVGSFEGE